MPVEIVATPAPTIGVVTVTGTPVSADTIRAIPGSRVRSGAVHQGSQPGPRTCAALAGSWASRNSSCSVATMPLRSAMPSQEQAATRAPPSSAARVLASPRPRR
ncbi:MAG TPA: hypothetical protein VH478_19260 [Trebonia sp.]|nr:hypothetical protein [Trebonia sp.]